MVCLWQKRTAPRRGTLQAPVGVMRLCWRRGEMKLCRWNALSRGVMRPYPRRDAVHFCQKPEAT